ncbi:hypothetical protein TBR22_A27300 [Luteitalea sp. TBR-22]|nr:hypothetical protein TBR22_A27300 [Luteitalea sp. TBR-22]
MRKPLLTRVRAVRRPMLVEYRLAWALLAATLVMTEKLAMTILLDRWTPLGAGSESTILGAVREGNRLAWPDL